MRKKMKKARPFEKLLIVLLNASEVGKKPAVGKNEIAEQLNWDFARGSKHKGPKIYNVSSYIWDIKNIPQVEGRSIVIKSIRDGKKVTAYQLGEKSVADARTYLEQRDLIPKVAKQIVSINQTEVPASTTVA